jgi:hypothetical protein
VYAPVAIFTYNRPAHTKRLLECLAECENLDKSHVSIYCDGAKHADHINSVKETRHIISELAPAHAKLIERKKNLGLAQSVITGVTELCKEYGRVIVLEDDLVLSPHALSYLNNALNRYSEEERVMHISAYMYPVKSKLSQPFFYREATCWGWATWDRAWKYFEPDAEKLVNEIEEQGLRYEFNIEDSMYFYQMLCKQRDGVLDSWGIRWYASIFRSGGLALHPPYSLVQNLGFDGSGVHCNIDTRFEVELGKGPILQYPREIKESRAALRAMIEYRYNTAGKGRMGPLRKRLRRFLGRFH